MLCDEKRNKKTPASYYQQGFHKNEKL